MDTLGVPWLVYEGDPAWPLVKRVKELKLIVLPRRTLLTGVMEEVEKPEGNGIAEEMLTDGLRGVVIRATRAYDIWRFLNGDSNL